MHVTTNILMQQSENVQTHPFHGLHF